MKTSKTPQPQINKVPKSQKTETKSKQHEPTTMVNALRRFKNISTFQQEISTLHITPNDLLATIKLMQRSGYGMPSQARPYTDAIVNHLIEKYLPIIQSQPDFISHLCKIKYNVIPSLILDTNLTSSERFDMQINNNICYDVWKQRHIFYKWHINLLNNNDIIYDIDNFINITTSHNLKPSEHLVSEIINNIFDLNAPDMCTTLDKIPSSWCTNNMFRNFFEYIVDHKVYKNTFAYKQFTGWNRKDDDDNDKDNHNDNNMIDQNKIIMFSEKQKCAIIKIIKKMYPNGIPTTVILDHLNNYKSLHDKYNKYNKHNHCTIWTLAQYDLFEEQDITHQQFIQFLTKCSNLCVPKSINNNDDSTKYQKKYVKTQSQYQPYDASIDIMLIQYIYEKYHINLTIEQIENLCIHPIDEYMLDTVLNLCKIQHNETMFANCTKNHNLSLIKYFLDRKYTFKEEYLLNQIKILNPTELHKNELPNILNLLLKYGVSISPRLHGLTETMEFGKYTNKKTGTQNTTHKKLQHLFKTSSLPVILRNIKKSAITPDTSCFEAAMYNKNNYVIAHVLNECGFIPQIFDVIKIPDLNMRFQVLNKFYPHFVHMSSNPHYEIPLVTKMLNVNKMDLLFGISD